MIKRNDEHLKAPLKKSTQILPMEQDLQLEVTVKTTNTSSAVTINTNFNDKLFSICTLWSFIHSGVMKEEGNIC